MIEITLRKNLFQYVSYSNSESIDQQLIDRDTDPKWNMLLIGDSETRWGVDPRQIDSAFQNHNIEINSFNHAFDGFGASWWSLLLPSLLEQPSLRDVEVVVLGVQLTSSHRMMRDKGEDCGALQRPVLSSPFGKDLGVDKLCSNNSSWDRELARKFFYNLWLARYSSAVRTLILPSFMSAENKQNLRFNSAKSGNPVNGFVPHRSIALDIKNYDSEFSRWKAQYVPERHFIPLEPTIWPNLTSPEGFFDQLNSMIQSRRRTLVLFALPTNPTLIDTLNRREDYLRNSELLEKWAINRGVVFVDLGIQDVENSGIYFSDMRHLSGVGAKFFSRKLGEQMAIKGVLSEQKNKAHVRLNSEKKIN